jgi:transcriptional regulator with GAF, ATPase, and Fis domain/response regulator of citrate/malate metabolism
MSTKILIVEDHFVEANALRILLEKAGYTVCGTAMSYEQALPYLRMARPDIVLLDIFLKGELTGIHLAKVLANENIPFIYLSANSNQSTLEEAKATKPYGFLVKPFREKDVLMALDIANYRHQYVISLRDKQEQLLQQLLNNVINEGVEPNQRRILIAKAFKQFIPFEYIVIDTNLSDENPDSVFCCQRVAYDDYVLVSGKDYIEKAKLPLSQYNLWRSRQTTINQPLIENGADFNKACAADPVLNTIADTCRVHSRMGIPVFQDGKATMYITFFSKQDQIFNIDHIDVIESLRSNLALVLKQVQRNTKTTIPDQLKEPPVSLAQVKHPLEGIIGKNPKLLQALDHVVQVADHEISVLILGETGVGKEGMAYALHHLSGRRKYPFVKINCAAIPSTLIESELFGHEKGAFTGATERRIGKFEQAQGGTIFLDEIGEMPLEVQSKLLRVLQEKEVERLGGRSTIKINVRIVAATNRNLHKDVAAGRFRMDLYYRINIFPITVPPLRERKDDIPLLVAHFLNYYKGLNNGEEKTISAEALESLMHYSWPGNVRELQHVIERNILLQKTRSINFIELPAEPFPEPTRDKESSSPILGTDDLEKKRIIAALKACEGKISGKDGASEILGLTSASLYSKMKKLNISWKYSY